MKLKIEDLQVLVQDGKNQRVILEVPKLEVSSGVQVCISGISGSGKNTLLKLISGLITGKQGSTIWQNNNKNYSFQELNKAQRTTWRRENAGIIFQDFQLIPELSMLENVLLPFTFSNSQINNQEKDRAKELLKQVNLDNFAQRVQSLSRGEMQRVAYVRAIFNRPKVIFADEPTASLDRENANIIHNLLMNYTDSNKISLFLVSHDQSIAQSFKYNIHVEKGQVSGDLSI